MRGESDTRGRGIVAEILLTDATKRFRSTLAVDELRLSVAGGVILLD